MCETYHYNYLPHTTFCFTLKLIFSWIWISLPNLAFFTVKSPSVTQRSVSPESPFKKSKNPSLFFSPHYTQWNYTTVGSAIVAIAIVGRGGWAGLSSTVAIDKWFGLPQCLKTYHLSLYNIKKDMLLTGPFAMLSMPSFDFHLPPCTEGFLIYLSALWQLPLWQLPLFPSVAQFPCVG